MKTKICSKCNVTKDVTEYHKDNKKPDGLRYECKDCKRAQLRASYHKHKDARKELAALRKQQDK